MSGEKRAPGRVLYRDTPIGTLGLVDDGQGLSWVFVRGKGAFLETEEGETPLTAWAAAELEEYFAGARRAFSVPLSPHGTQFQQAVWQALRDIPYGQTRSYGEIAELVGRPRAARAAGMAPHRNPLLIFTPCHRVVGKNGALTGFACGLEVKRRLLRLEAEISGG